MENYAEGCPTDYPPEIPAQQDGLGRSARGMGRPCSFKRGDAVIYTNEYGVQFRSCINGFYRPTEPSGLYARGMRYYLDSSAPWMPVAQSSLRPDDSA